MTDSSFSPADAEGLAAWFARAEANAAGLRHRLRDFGTDQRPHHRDRHKDPKATTAALTSEEAMDRIPGNYRRDDLR
jgi:aspartate aminotransferase-like enzyme